MRTLKTAWTMLVAVFACACGALGCLLCLMRLPSFGLFKLGLWCASAVSFSANEEI